MMRSSTFCFLSCIWTICSSVEILDLSYTFNVDAPVGPSLSPFEHKPVSSGQNKYKVWLELNDFCSSEHGGTHVDAPVHMSKGKWTVDEIPTERLFRVPGVKINLVSKSSSMSNYEIKPQDLEDWESYNGIIPDGAVVLLETGRGKLVYNLTEYMGLDKYKKYNYAGLSVPAAKWLASHGSRHVHSKGIIGVGVDTASLDVGQSVDYPAHVALFNHNIFGLENVANMHRLPSTGFLLTIMPVKIGGGSGAPSRIIAETGDGVFLSDGITAQPIGMALLSSLVLLQYALIFL